MPNGDSDTDNPSRWVPVIVAIGLCTAVNALTFAVLYDAVFSQGPGLSENATQILTTVFGGMIGLLGSAIGYRAGTRHERDARNGSTKPDSDH